jgi:DNA-binding IscR family transcriptional regulator
MSTRGAAGGYQLSKPPEEISLGEVMSVIEGPESEFVGVSSSARAPSARVLRDAWQEIARVERDALHSLTFGEMAARMKLQIENMYYI